MGGLENDDKFIQENIEQNEPFEDFELTQEDISGLKIREDVDPLYSMPVQVEVAPVQLEDVMPSHVMDALPVEEGEGIKVLFKEKVAPAQGNGSNLPKQAKVSIHNIENEEKRTDLQRDQFLWIDSKQGPDIKVNLEYVSKHGRKRGRNEFSTPKREHK